MSQIDFASLPLQEGLLNNLTSLGYHTMTPIQAQSLPAILAGQDVIGQGKTGSGKTAAFGLGLLHRLDVAQFRVQALVLCPTRELADQVAKELRRLARGIHNIKVLTLCGGMPLGPQIGSLEHGAHVIVGTPGRIEEHLQKQTLDLGAVNTVVLDEADRMLDMGFQPAVEAIVGRTPKDRQTLLFSATYPPQIASIASALLRNPVNVEVAQSPSNPNIRQRFYRLDNEDRATAVRLILMEVQPKSSVVFCTTKRDTDSLANELQAHGFAAVALHGDLDQRDRDQTLVRFSSRSASILVATDVAARGLDIDNLDLVINVHPARDSDVHTHRIGRTGRAGSKGLACTLFTEKEAFKIARLESSLNLAITPSALPPLKLLEKVPFKPAMATLQIDGGKKQKVRPGDILGALTGENGITGDQVGKIQIFEHYAYVAVDRDAARQALKKLGEGKLKGRSFRVRRV
ncbi:ATP-dependent RNA helicase DbpA [Marinobacter sp. C2H3]|uniref:ATP-dependent RNA helicase DbpA n=1 Tax=Marinobacter sp. C2H3 TaxID=3119003 RepID=UPI00300F18A2